MSDGYWTDQRADAVLHDDHARNHHPPDPRCWYCQAEKESHMNVDDALADGLRALARFEQAENPSNWDDEHGQSDEQRAIADEAAPVIALSLSRINQAMLAGRIPKAWQRSPVVFPEPEAPDDVLHAARRAREEFDDAIDGTMEQMDAAALLAERFGWLDHQMTTGAQPPAAWAVTLG